MTTPPAEQRGLAGLGDTARSMVRPTLSSTDPSAYTAASARMLLRVYYHVQAPTSTHSCDAGF